MMEMMEQDGRGWQYLLMAMASASVYQFSKTAPPTSANIRLTPYVSTSDSVCVLLVIFRMYKSIDSIVQR